MNTLQRFQNIEQAQKYGWSPEDVSKFLENLVSFEERLCRLLKEVDQPALNDVLIENICFSADNPVIGGAGLGLSYSAKVIFIDPKKLKPERLFECPNLLIDHEYGHLLIFHSALLWPSLPESFKENLKRENLGKDYLLETTSEELGNLVFYSLAESGGLDHPYFQGLKVDNLVKAGNEHELIFRNIKDAYFDTMAECIAHLIMPEEAGKELEFERRYLRESLLFYTNDLGKEKGYIFYPLLAYCIAYAKATHNPDLLQGINFNEARVWPEEFQQALPQMANDLCEFWEGISIRRKGR